MRAVLLDHGGLAAPFPDIANRKRMKFTIPGWQTFHAGVVIRAIDEALGTETNKTARIHLTHSRRYMSEFDARHPDGVIPKLMDKEELSFTCFVLRILGLLGVHPPLGDSSTMGN